VEVLLQVQLLVGKEVDKWSLLDKVILFTNTRVFQLLLDLRSMLLL
jgi:hypothetical protein